MGRKKGTNPPPVQTPQSPRLANPQKFEKATSVIEHKASLTIDDVRRELAEMKRDAVDAETKEEK